MSFYSEVNGLFVGCKLDHFAFSFTIYLLDLSQTKCYQSKFGLEDLPSTLKKYSRDLQGAFDVIKKKCIIGKDSSKGHILFKMTGHQ